MNAPDFQLVPYNVTENFIVRGKLKDDVYRVSDTYDMVLKSVRGSFEADIGMKYLNTLRSEIPNFVYYFGVARNVAPFVPTGEQYIGHMLYTGKSSHIFMEEVEGIPLKDALSFMSIDDINAVISQLLLSIQLANKRFGFQHGDLHGDNIIVRVLNEPIDITYDDVVLTTKYIATIIDYGLSKIVIDGVTYANKNAQSFNDIYRLFTVIIIALDKRKIDYKQTLYYRFLVELFSEQIEEGDQPIEEWTPVDFALAFYDYDVSMDLDPNMLSNIIQELSDIFVGSNHDTNVVKPYTYDKFVPIEQQYIRKPPEFDLDVNILMDMYPLPDALDKQHEGYYTDYLDRMLLNMCYIVILKDRSPSRKVDEYITYIQQLIKYFKNKNSFVYNGTMHRGALKSYGRFLEDVLKIN